MCALPQVTQYQTDTKNYQALQGDGAGGGSTTSLTAGDLKQAFAGLAGRIKGAIVGASGASRPAVEIADASGTDNGTGNSTGGYAPPLAMEGGDEQHVASI